MIEKISKRKIYAVKSLLDWAQVKNITTNWEAKSEKFCARIWIKILVERVGDSVTRKKCQKSIKVAQKWFH